MQSIAREETPSHAGPEPIEPRSMRLKIGVMGGATGSMQREVLARAHTLGRAIAEAQCVLVTGACPGLPLAAACGAHAAGGMVVGVSPGLSLDEHVRKYRSPTDFHDVLIFTGSGLMGREVVNIRSSDIVVIVGGRSGTLGELAIAYDEGKLIGVLTGTGGISDMVAPILAACDKDTGARVVYESEPERLVQRVLDLYRTEHHKRPSCFCVDQPIGEATSTQPAGPRDPVCGMTILPGSVAAARNVGGKYYVFCSSACVQTFDADPQRYVGAGERP